MEGKWIAGTLLRWKCPGGGLCKVVRYAGEDFYEVETIPDGRRLMGAQRDLRLNVDLKKGGTDINVDNLCEGSTEKSPGEV